MSASRKGLKRHGLRGYTVGSVIIHKETKSRWRIRPSDMHSAFFFEEHSLLRTARKAAEQLANGKRAWDSVLPLSAAEAVPFVDAAPDFKNRSALTIAPGLWRMRNGHTAKVEKMMDLPYGDGKKFPVWFGYCENCCEPKTWNFNGTYAAVGKHQNDIVERA